MKEEILKQLKPLIEEGSANILSVMELLKIKAPILLEQILRYKFIENTISVTLGILLLLIAQFCLFLLYKYDKLWDKKYGKDNNCCSFICIIIWIVGSIIGIIIVACNVFALIKIIVAPDLYLIEFITNLLTLRR